MQYTRWSDPKCDQGLSKNQTLVAIKLHRKPLAGVSATGKTVRSLACEDHDDTGRAKTQRLLQPKNDLALKTELSLLLAVNLYESQRSTGEVVK